MSDPRKISRVILAAITAFVLLFVLFASGPSFSLGIAQPAPTETDGYSIQLINPSGTATEGPGREASAKPEQTGAGGETAQEGYHLVAWVNEVPPGAFVEFKYQSGINPEVTITGSAGAIQNGDTFEYYWDLANAPEGSMGPNGPTTVSLRAVLYENGVEVARDTEPLYINNQTPATPSGSNEEQGETVEIIYPSNAGSFGTYEGVGVVDAVWSDGTTWIVVYYSVSPVGTEPEWIECGDNFRTGARDGIRCELEEEHLGTNVTAIAARANDTPEDSFFYDDAFHDSGDAHRVFGYEQDPATVTLAVDGSISVNANASGDYPCSPTITGVILDQFSRKIAGLNTDVHATGPADDLFFDDDESAEDDRSKAPDQNHGALERTVNCESSDVPPPFSTPSLLGPGSQQAEHERPGSTPDIKHIESSDGTSDAGAFSFELNNRTRTSGITNITMWGDEDNDDRLCSTEAQGHLSIGWGVTPTSNDPASFPEVSSCPRPTTTETTPDQPECSDGVDNDNDDQVDHPDDPGCDSPEDDSENSDGGEDPRGCTHTGDGGDNVIRGTNGDDIICAGGGDDTIYALDGDDIIYGEGGHDSVRGNRGNDRMIGGGGGDTLRGGRGADIARGRSGNDTIRAYSENDDLQGGAGNDVISGSIGNDFLKGNKGRDTLNGGKGNDRCRGGAGRDTVTRCER